MLTMYAIKHKHQDLFLPVVKGSNSKAELCEPKEKSPRLFKSYKGASQAMRAWAKGIHKGYGNWEGPDDPYSSGGAYFCLDRVDIIPKRHRKLDDVCVVEITMHMREIDRE